MSIRRRLTLVLAALLIAVLPPARAQTHVPRHCGDLLARLHLKPPGLTFVGCSFLPDLQGKPLRATYRLPGRFAVETERFFVTKVGMPMLRRSCCQWDGPRHSFRGADGQEYDVSMTSAETTARIRAAWPHVRLFQVVVETFTDEI